ncbi:hypothetical protein [Streptomyces sp. enrichment culture]|uniref:hypothetical protein n=1 Tax=Streptomyces sp. enrichment culture TaxID=1795815 RepID=UPI003F54A280
MSPYPDRPGTAHPTWWRVPLVASLLGLPCLVLDFLWFRSQDGTGAFGGILYWSAGLLVFAWLPPHRRALRGPRTAAAVAGLGCAMLPALFALALGAALTAN